MDYEHYSILQWKTYLNKYQMEWNINNNGYYIICYNNDDTKHYFNTVGKCLCLGTVYVVEANKELS